MCTTIVVLLSSDLTWEIEPPPGVGLEKPALDPMHSSDFSLCRFQPGEPPEAVGDDAEHQKDGYQEEQCGLRAPTRCVKFNSHPQDE